MNLARLMNWHSDKPHSKSQFIYLESSGSGANCSPEPANFMPIQKPILYWCDDLVFSGCDLSQMTIGVRPTVGFHQICCLLSPFLQNLLICQLVAHTAIPSPISWVKQLKPILDHWHTAAFCTASQHFRWASVHQEILDKCKNP